MFHIRFASLLVALTLSASATAAPYLGLFLGPPLGQPEAGAQIHFVVPGSPAAQAGFQPGDVIIRVLDKDVVDAQMLVETIRGMNAGDQVVITIRRADQEQQLTTTLAEEQFGPPPMGRFFPRRPMIGIGLEQVPDGELRIGDVIPQSPAELAGLKSGDVLLSIDAKKIESYQMLAEYVRGKQVGDEVVLTVVRDGNQVDHAIKLSTFGPR